MFIFFLEVTSTEAPTTETQPPTQVNRHFLSWEGGGGSGVDTPLLILVMRFVVFSCALYPGKIEVIFI